MLAILIMALFPILTSTGDPILTADLPVGFAIAVQGGIPPITTTGHLLVLSDRRDVGRTDAVTLDETTGAILSHIPTPGTLPYAALGDTVAGGTYAVTKEINPSSQVDAVNLYTAANALIISVPISTVTHGSVPVSTSPNAPLKSNGTDTWYLAIQSAPSVVYALDSAGTPGATVWTLPNTAPFGPVRWMAIRRDSTILYSTKTGGANGIQAYDLVNSVALPDFVTAGASEFFEDLSTLPNGDVLVLMQTNNATDVYEVQRYNSAGTLQQSYPIGVAQAYELPRLFLDYLDATSFWVKAFPDATGHTARYVHTAIDGTTLADFTVQSSIVDGDGKVPSTCPELVISSVTGVTQIERRLRRFALPWDGNKQQDIRRIEFLMQTGVGLSTGQGSDPQAMIRLSKDGGLTWGKEVSVSVGKMGEYFSRVYINRPIGSSNNRKPVCEITFSDPVFLALLDCLVDQSSGSS